MRKRGIEGRVPPDDILPPWAEYPGADAGSIAWRMGLQDVSTAWSDRMDQLGSVEARLAWLRRGPRAPATWVRMLAPRVGLDLNCNIARNTHRCIEALEELGVIENDVAFAQWVANVEAGASSAPHLSRRKKTPRTALEFSARYLGFWGRWISTHRHPEAAIARWGDLGPGWEPVITALRSQTAPSEHETPSDLAAELAVTGMISPPWTWPAEPLHVFHRDHPALAALWVSWAMHTYDDIDTWERYLAQWPAPSDEWRASMELLLYPIYHSPSQHLLSCTSGLDGYEVELSRWGNRYALGVPLENGHPGSLEWRGKEVSPVLPPSGPAEPDFWDHVVSTWAPPADQACFAAFVEVLANPKTP